MRNRRKNKNSFVSTIIGFVGIITIGVIVNRIGGRTTTIQTAESIPEIVETITRSDCLIKGNISQNSGKKYYHLPGMEDYESTVISPEHGEQWFCSEREAIDAGWVKAPTN